MRDGVITALCDLHAARAIYGTATPETIDRCKRGSGVIALFETGQGCVFTAGTCEWVAGLPSTSITK